MVQKDINQIPEQTKGEPRELPVQDDIESKIKEEFSGIEVDSEKYPDI